MFLLLLLHSNVEAHRERHKESRTLTGTSRLCFLVSNFTQIETTYYKHLVEILTALVRQHVSRCKFFILETHLASRVAQLLACPQNQLKLSE